MANGSHLQSQSVSLRAGEQIFVNGALIEADGPCRLRLGRTAAMTRGSPSPTAPSYLLRAIAELYRETVRVEGLAKPPEKDRNELVGALNILVSQLRTNDAQAQCSRYVAALGEGDIQSALAALRILAQLAQRQPDPDFSRRERITQDMPLAANT